MLLPAASGRCRYCDTRLVGHQVNTCGKLICHRKREAQRMADARRRRPKTRPPVPMSAAPSITPTGREATKERTLVCGECKQFVSWVPTLNGFGAYAERCGCGIRWPSPVPPRAS